ncbi:hypothetical protein JGB26_37150 [Streptomyces flavofungini]|uniref:DeoR-like transcriptional repressor C-terminal sensor domain-containing protein n=1 Tax=Streptomyces flavofungini TaxID=68200 RepID=A0ABS0XHE3_9ACTN|nr:hypothetical protein [Streptomyces flavofungini]MBJ3812637.1 hypothetical protein [Streptomyces flavofungini]
MHTPASRTSPTTKITIHSWSTGFAPPAPSGVEHAKGPSLLKGASDLRLIGLNGMYHKAGDAFLGGMTVEAIRGLSVDLAVLSTSAITAGTCYHQTQDTVSFKRAMMDVAAKRILYVDHTEFDRRALHALARSRTSTSSSSTNAPRNPS